MTRTNHVITCHALRVKQQGEHSVYQFSLTAKELAEIADISRIARTEGVLEGYQRGLAREHIDTIAAYLNSEQPLFPNGPILALPSSVKFEERRGPGNDDGAAIVGRLSIPIPRPGDRKPAWIVDGQQRFAALAKAEDQDFPIPITAFTADTVDIQRDQFIRINSVKPLETSLVTELLPEVTLSISPRLAARKVPSALVNELNSQPDSPFLGLIRRSSTPAGERRSAVVTDTSLVNALEESLSSASGCLFPYRNLATGETDFEAIWALLIAYWSAVRDVFPEAWALPSSKSRLMHGVGIRSMSRLMDRMMGAVDPADDQLRQRTHAQLMEIAPSCHWTGGTWDELGGIAWNDLQNVPKHIRMLSNYLVRIHMQNRFGLR